MTDPARLPLDYDEHALKAQLSELPAPHRGHFAAACAEPHGDDTDGSLGERLSQVTVFAVLYAMRTLRTGEPQEAVWAARQLYDAADLLVQQGAERHQYLPLTMEQPAIRIVLDGIRSISESNFDSKVLKGEAQRDGEQLLELLIDSD